MAHIGIHAADPRAIRDRPDRFVARARGHSRPWRRRAPALAAARLSAYISTVATTSLPRAVGAIGMVPRGRLARVRSDRSLVTAQARIEPQRRERSSWRSW